VSGDRVFDTSGGLAVRKNALSLDNVEISLSSSKLNEGRNLNIDAKFAPLIPAFLKE